MSSADRPFSSASAGHQLDIARQHLREGRLAEAEESFELVLAAQPGHVEALRFLGNSALARGDAGRSVTLLSTAAKSETDNAGVLVELGIAYRSADRLDAARYVLERAVSISAARNAYARLLLAEVLELDRRPELALLHSFRAMIDAQRAQRWTTERVDEAQLRSRVEHAQRYIAQGRRAWFENALRALRLNAPDARWDRVDAALGIFLGERALVGTHPGQQAGLLYVPDIATSRFLDPARFPWLGDAAGLLAVLGDEVEACIASSPAARTAGANALRLPVLQRGLMQYEARRHAPRLLATLAGLPLARIPNHAPDSEIVAVDRGAHCPQDHGLVNSRCRAIVNLADSAALEIVAGGERRILEAGQSAIVDPSFGIAYANVGKTRARAIVFELWHPDLTEEERQALSALFVAAIDFDSQMQELP